MKQSVTIFSLLRRKYLSQLVAILLIVNFLNASVDPVDPTSFFGHENLAINDIESVVELVLEEAFGLTDSCREADDPDFDQASGIGTIFFIQDSKEFLFFHFGLPVRWNSRVNVSLPDMLANNFTPPPRLA